MNLFYQQPRTIDLAGQRFGRLTALGRVENNKAGKAKWLCLCECGQNIAVVASNLRSGRTQSCGCISRDNLSRIAKERNTVHGHNKVGRETPTHSSWVAMVKRCRNPNNKNFPNYGGRGITVYEPWLHFQEFLKDMGERPDGKTLDRVDVDGQYEPGNCRWATKSEQQRNKRDKTNPRGVAAFRREHPTVTYSDIHIRTLLRSGKTFGEIDAAARAAGRVA